MGFLAKVGHFFESAGRMIGGLEPEQKMVQMAIEGSIPFRPYADPKEGESAAMRAAYRSMSKEPVVRACLDTLVQSISSLDLETLPGEDTDRGHEIADFCNDLIVNSDEGILGIAEAILMPGYEEGYSISEPVWRKDRYGKWAGKETLKVVKPKPSDVYWLEVDKFLDVVGVRSTLKMTMFSPDDFIHFRNQPKNNYPTGVSVLRACYRAAWMLDTAWKFRAIAMERYSLPLLIGRYPLGRSNVQKALYETLKRARGAGVLTIPEEAMVEAITLSAKGQSDFQSGIQDLKEDIAVAILGGSLQTLVGYGAQRGDTNQHAAQGELRVWRGSVSLCQAIKHQLYKPAVLRNFGPAEPIPTPALGGVNESEVIKGLEIDERMQRMGWKHSKSAMGKRTRRTWAETPEDELAPPQSTPAPGAEGAGQLDPFKNTFSERGIHGRVFSRLRI